MNGAEDSSTIEAIIHSGCTRITARSEEIPREFGRPGYPSYDLHEVITFPRLWKPNPARIGTMTDISYIYKIV